MIPTKIKSGKTPEWQRSLAQAIRDPHMLAAELDLGTAGNIEDLDAIRAADAQFATRVPREFVSRMRTGDRNDPLLRQVLPTADETSPKEGYGRDPVGDLDSHEGSGILRKYHGRALLIASGACAIHCRYCFRRHFPYNDHHAATNRWQPAIEIIAADSSISEVILSGGDPLSLTDHKLTELLAMLENVPHVRRLRIHTRQPIVLPSRVNESLLAWMSATRFSVAVVVHCNHAREIDDSVIEAISGMRSTGAQILNQSVLLKGVNDDVAILCELSETLFAAGVLPYYLHMLDPVAGAAHFSVSENRARRLMEGLRSLLPGYLVPRLVREEPGKPSKTPL